MRARVELIDAAVEIPDDSVLRFDLGMQEDPFLEIDPSAGATTPRADRVVAVFDAESGEYQLFHVRDVVTVGVFEKEDVR